MLQDYRTPNRVPPSWKQLINPVWWASDEEWNKDWSWWKWFKRNPFHNFKTVIIGISHKHRNCHYTQSGLTYAISGWNMGYTTCKGCLPRPFISYRGVKKEWCIGWMTSGVCTVEWRTANSPNASKYPH